MTKPRFLKTNIERLDDTLLYIELKLSVKDAQEVADKLRKLSENERKTLGGTLSIGSKGTSSDDRTANREARRAKRSLMLCASLFIENTDYRTQEVARVKVLSETSEKLLVDELKSWFVLPEVSRTKVADIAVANMDKMPKWNNVNFKPQHAIRGHYFKGRDYQFNCYNGVVYWAFQAGAISKRFLFNKSQGKDGNAFFPIFSKCGWMTDIEYSFASKPAKLLSDRFDGDKCVIEKGLAVYFVTPHKKFGHVALSLGDGRVISQNAVCPAFKDKIKQEDRLAVSQMERAETHIISIRNFWDIHYNPDNGYHKLQHTSTGFWEAYKESER